MRKSIFFIVPILLFPYSIGFPQSTITPDFQKVFSVLSSKKFFKMNQNEFDESMKTLCQPLNNTYEYSCLKTVDINFMELSGEPNDGFLKSAFYGVDKCAYMISQLTKEFGKPQEKKSECIVHWSLPPLRAHENRRYINLQQGKKTELIYYSIGYEQM